MQLSQTTKVMMFVALPLLAVGGFPAAPKAQEPPPPARAHPYAQRPAPAGYGWRQRAPIVVAPPASRNGCGVFRYWDGQQCQDARDTPPKLD